MKTPAQWQADVPVVGDLMDLKETFWLNPGLWQEVRQVLLKNKAERHLRGGEATRCKYLHRAARPPGARG